MSGTVGYSFLGLFDSFLRVQIIISISSWGGGGRRSKSASAGIISAHTISALSAPRGLTWSSLRPKLQTNSRSFHQPNTLHTQKVNYVNCKSHMKSEKSKP